MKTKHTPTPWLMAVNESEGFSLYGDNGKAYLATIGNYLNDEANAAFIVRAVNSHDKLVALAHNIAFLANSNLGKSEAGKFIIQLANEALAQAKGKEGGQENETRHNFKGKR